VQFPIDITLGPLRISSHLVFELLAYVLGFRYYLLLRVKSEDPISEDNRLWILIGGAFGALIFSRLIGSLENPSEWAQAKYPLLYMYQSKTIMGGLAGGLLGVEIAKLILGEKNSSGDLFTLPLIVAIMIGRIGCFLSGVSEPTYGISTSLPWGMNLGDGVLRHPTSLYEILFLCTLWALFYYFDSRISFEMGIKFKLFMVSYFSFRFLIELIKPVPEIFMGLSTIQLLCIAILLYYSVTIKDALLNPKNLIKHEY